QHGFGGSSVRLPHLDVIQAAFGDIDVSGVKAHIGGPAAEAAEQMGARAYASGESVAFAVRPDLHTAAHEAAHVVQHRGGVSLPTRVGTPGDSYERRAGRVADHGVAGDSARDLLAPCAGGGAARGGAVQHKGPGGGDGSAPGGTELGTVAKLGS